VVVFGSDIGIEILTLAKRIHGDGTFEVTPPLFSQVYLIHAWYKHKMFPCIIILMTGKSFELYKIAFGIVKEQAMHLRLVWNPEEVLTDFEQAAIKAYQYHFPQVRTVGCYFHFAQCFWRKFIEFGFKTLYEEEHIKMWFKRFVALPLVPTILVTDLYQELRKQRDDFFEESEPEYSMSVKFLDYVYNNWINEPLFPISMWNHFETKNKPRTNNHVEGYNNALNKLLKSHPNIYKFIEEIANEESTQHIRFCRLKNGRLQERHRDRSDVERDLNIANYQKEFLNGDLDAFGLLDALTSCVPDFEK
jgi:hypothetical protein